MELLDILKDTLISTLVGIFLVAISTIITMFVLKAYTKINFEESLLTDKSEDITDIPNDISVKIIITVFTGVFFLMGISALGFFSII